MSQNDVPKKDYEKQLEVYNTELVKFQEWVKAKNPGQIIHAHNPRGPRHERQTASGLRRI